ncbi:DUF4202 domain-containing protein [Albibacterium bauzanense]|uniref:Uncharacterized protein DUF4202 n=1 Tax=Albibacterium bauzanense TaxID=653929 RepID=A0A4R1LYV5_9SPHI|nr:DUF4202 domain-containing protein [Albibacterium bauzanense]TCK84756.1 uncharacterized protein DUF4202 [Albibacterium bauzanense]
MNKLELAFEKYDAYNRKDPISYTYKGEVFPEEYFLAKQLYGWVLKLDPEPSEELLLASRSQHIGRWEIPRSQYPEGKTGYLDWRRNLAIFHADKSTAIMKEVGYKQDQIDRVRQFLLKKKIKVDKEVQTLENALCLVFLEFQYEDFFPKYEPEKIVNILRKSLLKMDEKGREQALTLHYSDEGLSYIKQALEQIS